MLITWTNTPPGGDTMNLYSTWWIFLELKLALVEVPWTKTYHEPEIPWINTPPGADNMNVNSTWWRYHELTLHLVFITWTYMTDVSLSISLYPSSLCACIAWTNLTACLWCDIYLASIRFCFTHCIEYFFGIVFLSLHNCIQIAFKCV